MVRFILAVALLFAGPVQAQQCWDLNSDRQVDFTDFILFSQEFGEAYDFADFVEFAQTFGKPTDCAQPSQDRVERPSYPNPSNVVMAHIGPCSIRVTWDIPVSPDPENWPLTGIRVERSPHLKGKDGAPAYHKDIVTVSAESAGHTIYPVMPSTRYKITVRALYVQQYSGGVSETVVTPAFQAHGPPVLVLFDRRRTGITVMWGPQPGSRGYQLRMFGPKPMDTGGWINSHYTKITFGSSTDRLPPGDYLIEIKSYGPLGPSGWSDPLAVCVTDGFSPCR